ncbi:kinesin-like protein [Meredithblackwellia eburnea MCA 4105]
MEGNNTFLDPPAEATGRATERETKSFAFDKSYWSACPKDEPGYASQETLYNDLGKDLLDHSFEGFNTCIFAYGQTGSGKSYSMMGYGEDRGIIPLICEALFERIETQTTDKLTFTVEVSYTEIYQEKVRDLLNPSNKGNLKVREHPTMGPYVESLSKLAVQSFKDIEQLMDEGTKARTVAATNMNETSSRSHAVFTLLLTQRRLDVETGMAGEKVSRISLVDLAGSERANSTGATGTRLKEGALINKSLTTLGRVIQALAAASSAGSGKSAKAAAEKVPYRDSVLTWLLKDSLGGNSKTAMVAAISPADYEETLSTLRYADQAKKIKNKAVVNEDPNAKLIRELKEELSLLRGRMSGATDESIYNPDIPAEKQIVQYRTKEGEIKTISKAELQDQLEASEKLMASVTESWEQKIVRTQEIQKEREQALEALGITIEKNLVGVSTPKKLPHLVNLNEDPLMAECLLYQIKPGKTVVGNLSSDKPADIRLSGASILPEHCHFECSSDGVVSLHSRPNSTTMVNGQRLSPMKPKELHSGYRVILGDFHVFRFNHPEEVRKARDGGAPSSELRSPFLNGLEDDRTGTSSPITRPQSPESNTPIDWSYARREAVVARLNGTNVNLDKLKDEELNKLYSDILRVRHSRTGSSVASGERPESRMSFLDSVTEDGDDDDESGGSQSERPFSGSTWSTGQTSLGDTTVTLGGPAELDDRLSAVKEQYEERLKTMADSAMEAEEVKVERNFMEQKVKNLEKQMKAQKQRYESRVKQLKAGTGEVDAFFDSPPMTEEEERLAIAAVAKWRRRRRVRMAEDALSQAVAIKEANVISRELKKNVSFQFVVVERNVPSSGSESISGLGDIEDVSDAALDAAQKPCIGVKVLDRRNQAIYIWSLTKLQQRLQQMRNLYKFIGTEYSQHFSWEDPFYESPPLPGGFSFVGSAIVSLAPLSRNLPSNHTVHITSPYTADPMGTCRVSIKPVSIVMPTPSATPFGNGNTLHSSLSPFVDGATLTIDVSVDRVSGLTKAEFSSVHIQISLSSFFGPAVTDDEVMPSASVDLDSAPSRGDLRMNRTLVITLTPSIQKFLAEDYATVYFFAKAKPAHLDKIERWDEARDSSLTSKVANLAPLRGGDPLRTDVTRRNETELVSEQRHDVLAGVEVRELGEEGEYVPVQVVSLNALDGGAFFLRQGLQRRFVLKLQHNSGRGWLWKRVSKVTLGNVRMLDARGRIHAATSDEVVELRPSTKFRPVFNSDGSTTLSFTAPWDSSAHDSPFLNKNTVSGNRALLRLQWEIDAEQCEEPVIFGMDIAVTVSSRDARPPSKLMSLFSSSKMSSRITNLFAVRLVPALTKKPADIWRLNTAETFVRNEEILGSWKPRGLTLIRDFEKLVESERKAADVEATKAVLAAFDLTLPSPSLGPTRMDRLGQVIELWQKHFGTKDDISLERETTPTMLDLSPSASPSLHPSTPPLEKKLHGTATIVPRTDTAARRGHMAMLRDPTSDKWKKYWIVLRRPYLYLYESSSEIQETTVINISTVRVEQSPEIEQMLERKFSFAIFTHQNSYFFQAPDIRSMLDWIKSIDPSLA